MISGRIVVAYAGVHQAYQLALAADEIGELKTFYCALYDDPAKWAHRFADFVGHGLMEGRHAAGLDLSKVVEFPWPLLLKVARDRIYRRGRDGWLAANSAFDWWVARKIAASPPDIFVGTATSDLHCLRAAKACGSLILHDCPGLHPEFESRLLREAADKAGIRAKPRLPWLRRQAMATRKIREYALADILLVCSEFQRKAFEAMGFDNDRLFVSSVPFDPTFWRRTRAKNLDDLKPGAPLKLLFAGAVVLRKGIPFLLRAVARCGKAVELTIIGTKTSHSERLLDHRISNVSYLPAQPQTRLRGFYESHDVFVLPSVCDTFGKVALEAMACGLPVIITDNCGVPVPDASWRVPPMDPERLAARIMHYANHRSLVIDDGERAAAFAANFTAQAYRRNIQTLFKDLFAARPPERKAAS